MDRPRRDSRQHNGITVCGLSQPTFATKSAQSGRSRNDDYGMENVPLHFHEPAGPPKMYPVGGKAETCARIEFFAGLPRAELAAEVKVWWAWAFTGARRALGCHAKADNAQS